MIQIDIKKELLTQNNELKQTNIQIQKKKFRKENIVMNEIQKKFDSAMHYLNTDEKIPRGDDDWYKHVGVTMKNMINDGISKKDVVTFLVNHIVDFLLFSEKIELMNDLYSDEVIQENSLQQMMKEYLDSKLIVTNRLIGMILFRETKRNIVILKNSQWINAEPEDEREIAEEASKKFSFKGKEFNHLVGFVGLEQKNNFLVFKTKQTDAKRNTGARCDEAVKSKKIQLLNMILGEEKYTKENTKGMVQPELCSLQEFLFRYYNKINKNNKVWFLDYDLSMLYNF
jgi:hypothetical protein